MIGQKQHEPRSDHFLQLHFRQLLHWIDGMQGHDQPKGMIINGSKGIGKTIGVVTFLSTKKDMKKRDQ